MKFKSERSYSNIGEAGSRLEVGRRGEYQRFVTVRYYESELHAQLIPAHHPKLSSLSLSLFPNNANIGIRHEVEANNSGSFFIDSYTNIFRSGEFLSNSKARSSYSPKFGQIKWDTTEYFLTIWVACKFGCLLISPSEPAERN